MTTLLWSEYKHFPYERKLALREVQAVLQVAPDQRGPGVRVPDGADPSRIRRLTYFGLARTSQEKSLVPLQAELEQGLNGDSRTARRQSTRYSAHGFHEYKGKFNPQVVRAVGNILGAEPGAAVLDPFCGSGTTLLEAAHNGWHAVGADLHPLAVLIANAKVTAFRCDQRRLAETLSAIASSLRKGRAPNLGRLPNTDYLKRWFHESTLGEISTILTAIDECAPRALRHVFQVLLSDILRDASLQEPADLRIRKRKSPAAHYPVIEPFLNTAERKLEAVRNARESVGRTRTMQRAYLLDMRTARPLDLPLIATLRRRRVDLALTSPPYVTALPYIDIHRLSLCVLGLITHNEIMPREKSLIGNREITRGDRESMEPLILDHNGSLPDSAARVCRSLLEAVQASSDGFRRQNVPALTYKYFCDMSLAIASVRRLVKQGGYFALLVGPNRTTLGGTEFRIDTPALLAELAEAQGWTHVESMPFETFQRFDLHQSNSIREEQLVVLKNS